MSRLIRLKKYLAEAELDADNNKLYIDDLKLSIKYEQSKTIYEAMIYDKHLIGAFSNQQD
jgi:hypothetical protein